MGAFEYTVLDPRGREQKGVAEGDNARQVRQQLRGRGLVPLAVEEVAPREVRGGAGPRLGRGLSATDLALITRQLATLVRAGVPLEEALRTVARQSEKARVQRVVLAVRAKVLEGHAMAEGLGEQPHVFPELYRATVAAGEQAGHLDIVLERLADYTEGHQQMRQKVLLALLYPAILTVVALAVVIGLLAYVVPQVVQVFDSIHQDLPWMTRALISVSESVRAGGLAFSIVLVLAGWALSLLLRRPAFRAGLHRWLHRVPILGALLRGLNTARFTRTLSILTTSGVPVLQAMRVSAQVLSSLPMRAAVEQAAERVREGSAIAPALEQGGYFPPIALNLIASGEASGSLDTMLERAASNQERELETLIAVVMGLFEPLLILVMGGLVLVIVLAILLPIFDLNQLVH